MFIFRSSIQNYEQPSNNPSALNIVMGLIWFENNVLSLTLQNKLQ